MDSMWNTIPLFQILAADGNMTSDGRFTYFWNDENRMVSASNAEVVITYAYDHKGRMIRKNIMRTGSATVHIEYTWDGWNIITEKFLTPNSSFLIHNLWGLDLDGTLQGSGGVGGLLAVIREDGAFLPTYDANGNVSEYVSAADGSVAAHYDYSPFGETLVASGPLASAFTHRFSTKPYCSVTGFCEYQMRKYRPDIGRWMSRDPMGERGGVNLFSVCNNNLIVLIDIKGLAGDVTHGTKKCLLTDSCEILNEKIGKWNKHIEERLSELKADKYDMRHNNPKGYNNHIKALKNATVTLGRCITIYEGKKPPCCMQHTEPVQVEIPEEIPESNVSEDIMPGSNIYPAIGVGIGFGLVIVVIILYPPVVPALVFL